MIVENTIANNPVMAWRQACEYERQQRVNARGEQLFSQGYTIRKMASCYLVSNPKGNKYIVDPVAGECTCQSYQRNLIDCKHLIAVTKLLAGAHTVYSNGEIKVG